MQARDAVERAFPGATSPSSATISFSRDGGLTDADRAYLGSYAAWITGVDSPPEVRSAVTKVDTATSRPELASMLGSPDGALQLVNVNLNVGSAGGAADVIVSALRDHAAATAPAGLVVVAESDRRERVSPRQTLVVVDGFRAGGLCHHDDHQEGAQVHHQVHQQVDHHALHAQGRGRT